MRTLVFLLFTASAFSQSMWICTDAEPTEAAATERVLSCRPYDPIQDGEDLTVSHSLGEDYFGDPTLKIQVEAVSISFESITLEVVLECSDESKQTIEFNYWDIAKGTTATDRTIGTLCAEGASVSSVSIEPEWATDWRCDGCGTYTIDE